MKIKAVLLSALALVLLSWTPPRGYSDLELAKQKVDYAIIALDDLYQNYGISFTDAYAQEDYFTLRQQLLEASELLRQNYRYGQQQPPAHLSDYDRIAPRLQSYVDWDHETTIIYPGSTFDTTFEVWDLDY